MISSLNYPVTFLLVIWAYKYDPISWISIRFHWLLCLSLWLSHSLSYGGFMVRTEIKIWQVSHLLLVLDPCFCRHQIHMELWPPVQGWHLEVWSLGGWLGLDEAVRVGPPGQLGLEPFSWELSFSLSLSSPLSPRGLGSPSPGNCEKYISVV